MEYSTRVYTSSKTFGKSRYHLIDKKYDSVQIEQVNIDEKWGSRVILQSDELPALLKTLLMWYLEDAEKAATSELEDLSDNPF